jgi:putative transposase
MPTHFHFLVKVKNNISIGERHDISVSSNSHDSGKRNVMSRSSKIEEQFRKFFISYSKSYNKWCDRHGNLLQRPFKRVLLANEKNVIDKICYIHHNPIHHGYCEHYNEWKYSTYPVFTSEVMTKLIIQENISPIFSQEEWILIHTEFKENFKKGRNSLSYFSIKT